MSLSRYLSLLPVLLALAVLQGCASTSPEPPTQPPPFVEQEQIRDLQLAIMALDDTVDSGEARHAATIAIQYPRQLAKEYEISDPPLVHNMKVNLGSKPRGLCIHWTADLLARLQAEHFHTLDFHWGIANYDNTFRLEHSTVIISARGGSLDDGIVLDPWRYGGELFWSATLEDPVYQWYPQADIHARKRAREALVENRAIVR